MVARRKLSVELNNRGVAYLQKGSFHKSFKLFRDSVRNTITQISDPSPPPTLSQHTSHESKACWISKGVASFVMAEAMQRQLSSDCSRFLFSQGIMLVEKARAYSSDEVVDATVASSIVLFNLALVHHTKGLRKSLSHYLIKAQSLYCRSYQMLRDTGLPLGSSENPVIAFISNRLSVNDAVI